MTLAHYAPHIALCASLGVAAALYHHLGHHTPGKTAYGQQRAGGGSVADDRHTIEGEPDA